MFHSSRQAARPAFRACVRPVKHVLVPSMRLSEVDIYDLDGYTRGVPHDGFRTLRTEAPVHFHPEPGGRGFWAITRYADVMAAGKDTGLYSSRQGTNIPDYSQADLSVIQMMMINMDPPQHAKY